MKIPSHGQQVLKSSRILLVVTALLLCSCAHHPPPEPQKQLAQAEPEVKSPLPPPTGLVNDYAKVFDPASKDRLESLLLDLRRRSNVEFVVVTIETTNGQPMFDYSLAVARGWKVGPKEGSPGGGLVLMYAIKDRQWRLQVSRSLEKYLPNDVCKELGDQSVDLYKRGRYVEGIEKYVQAIIKRLESTKSTVFSAYPTRLARHASG